jgi:hypothetical protein
MIAVLRARQLPARLFGAVFGVRHVTRFRVRKGTASSLNVLGAASFDAPWDGLTERTGPQAARGHGLFVPSPRMPKCRVAYSRVSTRRSTDALEQLPAIGNSLKSTAAL